VTRIHGLLAALYASCGFVLAACADSSYRHDRPGWALLFAVAFVVNLVAAVHTWHLRDELRSSRARAERAGRPFPTAQDRAVAELLAPCCERWWTSAGAEHDPDHCTRKDQTT
jgi:hypothetical protein